MDGWMGGTGFGQGVAQCMSSHWTTVSWFVFFKSPRIGTDEHMVSSAIIDWLWPRFCRNWPFTRESMFRSVRPTGETFRRSLHFKHLEFSFCLPVTGQPNPNTLEWTLVKKCVKKVKFLHCLIITSGATKQSLPHFSGDWRTASD